MNISKNTLIAKTIALSALFLSYLWSTIVVSDFYGNLLSPVNAFAAGGILLYVFLESDRKTNMRMVFLVYSFACFVWGITDAIWAVMDFLGGDPLNNTVVYFLYFIPNVFIVAAVVISVVPLIKHWSIKKIAVDSCIIIALTLVLLWVVFFDQKIALVQEFLRAGFISIATITTDVFIVTSIFIWFLSVSNGKIPSFIMIISFGVFLYALIDIYYIYLEMTNAYVPNTIIDAVYMFGFQVVAFGALWKTYRHGADNDLTSVKNNGKQSRWIYLLLFPLASTIFTGFDLTILLIYVLLILLYQAASYVFK